MNLSKGQYRYVILLCNIKMMVNRSIRIFVFVHNNKNAVARSATTPVPTYNSLLYADNKFTAFLLKKSRTMIQKEKRPLDMDRCSFNFPSHTHHLIDAFHRRPC